MILRTILICLAAVAARPGFAAETLPTELPPAFFNESPEFAPFREPESIHLAPLGLRILRDGHPVLDPAAVHTLFREHFFGRIPRGTAIRVSKNARGAVVWDYPIGAWVSHVIEFNAVAGENAPFELRIAFKKAKGLWDTVVYLPTADRWVQRGPDTNSPTLTRKFTAADTGRVTEVSLSRVPQTSCRTCHFNLSPGNESFESPNDAGPCGFVAGNRDVETSWGAQWARQNGQSPFVSAFHR